MVKSMYAVVTLCLAVALGALLTVGCAFSGGQNLPAPAPSEDCIKVPAGKDEVVAGDYTVGALREFRDSWSLSRSKQGNGKIWWRPRSGDVSGGLTVTVVKFPLQSGKPKTFQFEGATAGATDNFYPSSLPLSSAGEWQLKAVSGTDQGCITISVG